jgi:ParB family chromosome partitioning protein
VAQKVGKSRSAVANTLRLLNLPEEIQESLRLGEISEGHARALLGLPDPDQQKAVWQETLRTSASVRDTERMVRDVLHPMSDPEPKIKSSEPKSKPAPIARVQDPNLMQIESDLRRRLGTKVELRQGESKGSILIEFYSDEDLERILNLMMS